MTNTCGVGIYDRRVSNRVNELWDDLLGQLARHRGKVVGTLLGLLLGWMVVEYGVLKTLFVVVCLVVGYVIGSRADESGGGRT